MVVSLNTNIVNLPNIISWIWLGTTVISVKFSVKWDIPYTGCLVLLHTYRIDNIIVKMIMIMIVIIILGDL